jgi:hypothetical protein
MWEEYVRIIGGKMKFANTNRTDKGEGKPLCTCIYAARDREKKKHKIL